ncbi:MAG: D-aminoacyl-tRNA deacylase [Alphaproteobacteria bacterium]
MRTLIQRVSEASVVADGETIGQIGRGLLVLVCAMNGDADEQAEFLARKVANLRIFEDEQRKMNKSILDVGGSALVVSQFTLAADTSRGNRPGFSRAARPEEGNRLYKLFSGLLTEHGIIVETGTFGADMKVGLVNDGPVTIWLDTEDR